MTTTTNESGHRTVTLRKGEKATPEEMAEITHQPIAPGANSQMHSEKDSSSFIPAPEEPVTGPDETPLGEAIDSQGELPDEGGHEG